MIEPPIEASWKGPPQCEVCGIRDHVLFSPLSDEEFAHISQPIDQPRFSKGNLLYQAGDPANYFYTIRKGVVKLHQEDANGNVQVVGLLFRGDVLGLESLVSRKYQFTAIAIDDSLTCQIPLSTIIELDHKLPHFREQLMSRWQRSIDEAEVWLKELRTGSIKARIAHLFIRMAEKEPTRIIFMPSGEDLGLILATKTETVSRIMAEIKRTGLLQKVAPHRFRVDKEGLTELIGQD